MRRTIAMKTIPTSPGTDRENTHVQVNDEGGHTNATTASTAIFDDKIALTVREAAVVMRVSPNTLYRMIARGELPSVRIGSRVFVPVAAIRKLYEI